MCIPYTKNTHHAAGTQILRSTVLGSIRTVSFTLCIHTSLTAHIFCTKEVVLTYCIVVIPAVIIGVVILLVTFISTATVVTCCMVLSKRRLCEYDNFILTTILMFLFKYKHRMWYQ